jgi:outer membrane receptor protein involved in Fe transport
MPALVFAQNTGKLAGRVLDTSTNDGLPGATVVLDGTTYGTATDVDGNYFIIGIPVGQYDVKVSFVGYQAESVEGVQISAGYTREINFEISPGIQLDEIVVQYERPLIQKDAIGAPRIVTSEEIANLPVRGIASVAKLQGGVVGTEGDNNLFIRGGREQEVAYYVDGVKVLGQVGVPQGAVQEQEMLIGTIPARYGDAQSGVISITTKSGTGNTYFGSLEAITSEALDDYGYNLFSGSFGGPIIQNKLSFFVSAEGILQSDSDPYSGSLFQLSDAALTDLVNAPQVLRATDAQGNISFVPFPNDLLDGGEFTEDDVDAALAERGLVGGSTGLSLVNHTPFNAASFYTGSDFNRSSSKDNPFNDYRLNGNVTFSPSQSISLRAGGTYNTSQAETYNYQRSLYNPSRFYNSDRDTWRAFGTWRHHLSNSTFYEVRVDMNDDKFWNYPDVFSKDVQDMLFYGDVDGLNSDGSHTIAYDVYDVARRYTAYDPATGTYSPQYGDNLRPATSVYGLFSLTGSGLGTYDKWHNQQFRLSASATTQIGVHQIEFGGEFEQRTLRRYRNIGATQFALYYNDGDAGSTTAGSSVDRYEDIPFDDVKGVLSSQTPYYGYDYLGINEVDSDDLDGYVAGTNYNRAPHKPIYYGGYIQDKIEYRDLVLNLGLRVDVFDSNALSLIDPYATLPIIRAGALAGTPSNIGDDYAVYFADGDAAREVIGYRDLDGKFYDDGGQSVTNPKEITLPASGVQGRVVEDKNAKYSSIFEDYQPEVIFMPRVGVSFPVTDQALFFASYNVTTQRPTEQAYIPAQHYVGLGTNARVPNTNLKPEITTQYELGLRQRVGARAALQISGFYRAQKNKIQVRQLNTSFPDPYSSYFNVDFTTTKGASFEFDLRRVHNVSLNANYTLSFAQGTGSDATTQGTIAWRGTYFPDVIAATAFDQRHTINLTLDYRLGEGEGPELFGGRLLQNFGINVIAQLGSGFPYTRIEPPNEEILNATNATVLGAINDTYMPWTSLINLRLDRQFELGTGATVTAFLWVENLLDSENIRGVFRSSGLATDDGFLSREAGRNWDSTQLDPASYAFHYSTFLSNPGPSIANNFAGTRAFGAPRTVRVGVRVGF